MGYCCFSVVTASAFSSDCHGADTMGISAKVHIKFGKPKNIITFVSNSEKL